MRFKANVPLKDPQNASGNQKVHTKQQASQRSGNQHSEDTKKIC
jgi:hypothetical protein